MTLPVKIVPAAVIGAPCVSWLLVLTLVHEGGSGATYALLFVGLPFALTLATAFVAGKRGAALPIAFLSAGIGLVSWLLVAVLFASWFAN